MAEKREEDLESNAARLAAEVQEATANNKRRVPAGGGRMLAAAGLFGAAALGVGFMFFGGNGDTGPVAPETARPDAFQTEEGSPFGSLTLPKPEKVIEKDTSESDALRTQMELMRAEIERLKSAPPPVAAGEEPPPENPALAAQLAALQGQIETMGQALEAAEKERTRALADKDRELARMQASLDAATLQGAKLGSDPGLDDAASRRAAAEELFNRRAASGMIAFGSSGGAGGAAAGVMDAVTGGGVAGRKLSANEEFAREAGAAATVERAKLIVNPSNTVIQGTMIQAVLETFINSDLPGQIRAVVAEDVHSYDGARILIPRGSKVIGRYSDNVEMGQQRAMVVWTRIIMPDNQAVDISSIGGDAIGQSGVTGRVNTHFGSRFGSATLISLLSIAPTLAMDNNDSENASDAADAVAENLTSATSAALEGALNRKPTITVKQGSLVTIMVDRDLEIF